MTSYNNDVVELPEGGGLLIAEKLLEPGHVAAHM
jgi:hypothetical protein